MKTYSVEIVEKLYSTVEVEAENEAEARKLVEADIVGDNNLTSDRVGETSMGWEISDIQECVEPNYL